ncbi:uncharacterized protein LOC104687386 [Corvus cornix cornix]|uniref:uncharacterized protein LOC104687386 n=1 Tax=Corvus cornix cornix TaxID=932674 RepID=UPI000534592B|nr:uncharacterized protein LOC104687386 [Corvus cornix cornix]
MMTSDGDTAGGECRPRVKGCRSGRYRTNMGSYLMDQARSQSCCQHERLQRVREPLSQDVTRKADVPNLWEVNLCLVTDNLTSGQPLGVWAQSPSVHANRRRNCLRCYNSLCLRLCCGGCGEELTRGSWNIDERGSLCRECYRVPETRSLRQCVSIVLRIFCCGFGCIRKALEKVVNRAWLVQREKEGIVEEWLGEQGHVYVHNPSYVRELSLSKEKGEEQC